MRRGELLGLTWRDIDLQRRTAYLPTTKNGEARTIPLSSRAVAILEAVPKDGPRVFPVSADAVKKAFTRACERAGLEGVVFHTLRHEATSRLSEKLPNVVELAAVTVMCPQ
ncbi:site-specific integrase [Noviherbaspirillum sp.]|uniref:site-specific integrase n=1 Tax=Noviherbaspirillum sp. TaxID=1926288 RepID=UPI0039C9F822